MAYSSLFILCVYVCVPLMTSSVLLDISSESHEPPLMTIQDNEARFFNHFKVAYTHRIHGKLSTGISDVTTSSILLKWELSNRTYNDSIIESSIICETHTGIIVSEKVVSSSGSYRIEQLQSDTKYIVCVYMLEKSTTRSNLTVLHFSCNNASTIPVLRSDSIVGVILTFGYIFLMATIGYFVWKKRSREVNEDKIRITVDEDDEEDDDEEDGHVFGRTGPAGDIKSGAGVGMTNKNSNDSRKIIMHSARASKPLNADPNKTRNGTVDDQETNGRVDLKTSKSSSSLLCGMAAHNTEMDDRGHASKARDAESSPIKVTEIAF